MATNYSWNSGSNDWFASGVWTPSGTPVAGDTATLGLSTTYTVTITGTDAAAATAVAINDPNATLAITGSLAVSNYLVNRGTLDLDSTAGDGGGSLTVAGVLDNAKIVQIGNSTASATTTASFGSLVNFSGATFSLVGSSAGPTTVTVGAVTNAGTIDVGANSTLALTSGKVFTQSAASGVTTIEGALTATTLTESAGSITVNGTLTATTLTESGGSLTVGSGGTLSATTLNLNGGTFAAPSLTVGTGQALVVGKTAVVTLSTGPLAVTSGIATITGTVDNTASLATTAVSVTAGGSLKLDNGFSFSGENVTGATGTYTAGTAGSLLELAAAGGHGTLSTLGGSTSSDAFQGFSELLVDAGASWTVNWDAATAPTERLIGSNGTNILAVATQGTVDLSNVSGFPTIDLAGGSGTYTVTVGTLTLSGSPVTIDDSASNGTATITSTDTTAGKTLTVKTGSGTNTFIGNKENDIVDAQTVTSSDTLTGGTGTNTLYLTTAGTYDLTGVSNFRYIHMASGGDTVTLADGTFPTGSTVIYGAASGADSITASSTTSSSTGKTLVYYGTTGSTGISLAGGTENDYIRASAAAVTGNTLDGGGGTNTLVMTTAGTVNLTNVSNFGLIYLAGTGNTVTLSATTLSGAVTLYGASARNNTVMSNASGGTPGNLLYVASAGTDTFTGGSENDTVRVTAAALAGGDVLDGGTGADLLLLTSAGSVNLTHVSNFGTINLAGGTNTVTGITDTTLSGAVTINGLSSKNNITSSATSSATGTLTYLGRNSGDVFTGNGETDFVSVTAAAVIHDTLNGSSSSANVLTLTTAGAVNLSNVTGFPTIDLANGNTAVTTTATQISGTALTGHSATNVNTLTLTNAAGLGTVNLKSISSIGTINLAASTTAVTAYQVGDSTLSGGLVTINDNAGGSFGNSINAQYATGSSAATLTYNATLSGDTFHGGTEQDVVKVSAANLSLDTLTAGGTNNTLDLTSAGTFSLLPGTDNFGTVNLATGNSDVTVGSTALSGLSVTINDAVNSNNLIDASGAGGGSGLTFNASNGADYFLGGAENDTVNVSAAAVGGDTLIGGTGSNTLNMSTAGSFNLVGVSGFSQINLKAGNNAVVVTTGTLLGNSQAAVTLADGATGNGYISVKAAAGNLTFVAGSGTDAFSAGAETDTIEFTSSTAGLKTISGFNASTGSLVFEGLNGGSNPNGFAITQDTAFPSSPMALNSSEFASAPSVTFSTGQQFAYDTANGQLWYSATSSTSADKEVAVFTNHASLGLSNLFFVS